MNEQQEVMAVLGDAGVLAGIRWAYISATDRVTDDYSEATGHDATWAGMTRFTLLRDRLDRVFACGKYALAAGGDGSVSLDLLHVELSEQDIKTMPHLSPDLVERADLNGSPGWAWGEWQWLLASCAYGKIDQLPWPQKSPTKQQVARQRNPQPPQLGLFEGFADAEIAGLELLGTPKVSLDRQTLVIAHAQDMDHGKREAVLGRPRLNAGGGPAWHWYLNLLTGPSSGGQRHLDNAPHPLDPDNVPDAPVRLRRDHKEHTVGEQASGQ
nr:hypothetical protein [Ferrimicrobium acidiphilum]